MVEDNGFFLLFLDGKINLEDFSKYVEKEGLFPSFVRYVIRSYKPDYFELLERFFRFKVKVCKFCFPVVSDNQAQLNYGLLIFVDFKPEIVSNHPDDSINSFITTLIDGYNCFVIFKDNQFSGLSFSGALYLALVLGKDIDKVAVSFQVNHKREVYKVSKVSHKRETARSCGVPFVTATDFVSFDDAARLVNAILNQMSMYEELEVKTVDISKQWVLFGYDINRLKREALSAVKYLHSQGLPAVILDKCDTGIKTPYRIFFGSQADRFVDECFMVVTDSMDVALSLKGHSLLQNFQEVPSLYALIDGYVRDLMVQEGLKAGFINQIVKLCGYYYDAIPAEKLSVAPGFMESDGLVYRFRSSRVRDYFLARFFVEVASNSHRKLILEKYKGDFLRFVVYHPEFLRLKSSLCKKLALSFYSSPGFRSIYSQEYETFIRLAGIIGLKDVYLYEQIKKAYIEADYENAAGLIINSKLKKADTIKANMFIDLWALDEAEKIVYSLDIEEYKKLGQLVNIYLKRLNFDKAFYYASRKMGFDFDRQKESYYILVAAYDYRVNGGSDRYSRLVSLFEEYLRMFEVGYMAGEHNREDIYYLLRNFSYSLINHPAYERYLLEEDETENIKPLYPFLVNYAYINKDLQMLRTLASERYFLKQPLENVAAAAALATLTGDGEDFEVFIRRYRDIIRRYNSVLSAFGLSTQLNVYDGDTGEFFKKLVYIQ